MKLLTLILAICFLAVAQEPKSAPKPQSAAHATVSLTDKDRAEIYKAFSEMLQAQKALDDTAAGKKAKETMDSFNAVRDRLRGKCGGDLAEPIGDKPLDCAPPKVAEKK